METMTGSTNATPALITTNVQVSEPSAIAHVAVKQTPFWENDPQLWFAQMESQFAIARVTADDTKYCYVLSSLSQQQVQEVRDIVSSPPSNDKYKDIKHALIDRLSQSRSRRLQQLLHNEEIGDRTPSQLLRKLKALSDNSVTDDVLRNIWMSRLPSDAQKILTVSSGDLDALARIADQLHELYPSAPSTFAVTSQSNVIALQQKVAELSKQIEARYHSSRRGKSPNRQKSPKRQEFKNADICFYHKRFGAKAKKCTTPCNFQKLENIREGQ